MTIQEIRELKAKATPGPWKAEKCGYGGFSIEPEIVHLEDDGGCGDPECCGGRDYAAVVDANNAKLIAALPDIAQLAIDLSEENKGLKEKIAWYKANGAEKDIY